MNIFSGDQYRECDIIYIHQRAADYEVLLTLVQHGWGGRIMQVEKTIDRDRKQHIKTPLLMTRNKMYSGEKEIREYIQQRIHEHHRNKFAAKRRAKTKGSNP